MSLSFFKSKVKIEKKKKISAVEILEYGNRVESRYNNMLGVCNYEIRRNMYLYVPSNPNVEIIGVDILAENIILRIDTIFQGVVVSVKDKNNVYVKSPEKFIETYKEGRVILSAISDILLKYYNSCLEFKSFKTDITKVKDTNGDFELEISPTGIFLCTEKKKDFQKYCSILYEHYLPDKEEITTATESEKELLKSLYVYIEDCPQWLEKECLNRKDYSRKSKKKILRMLKNYLGGLR